MDNGFDQQQRQPRRPANDMDAGGNDSSSSDHSSMEEDTLRFEVFRLVGTRPQFQVERTFVIREAGPRWGRIYRVEYRGGRIIKGTRAFINRDLGDRISEAANALLRDPTLDWERWRLPLPPRQQQQQQQQQHLPNGQ